MTKKVETQDRVKPLGWTIAHERAKEKTVFLRKGLTKRDGMLYAWVGKRTKDRLLSFCRRTGATQAQTTNIAVVLYLDKIENEYGKTTD